MSWFQTYLIIHFLFGYGMVLFAAYPEFDRGVTRSVTFDNIAVTILLGLPMVVIAVVHESYRAIVRRSR